MTIYYYNANMVDLFTIKTNNDFKAIKQTLKIKPLKKNDIIMLKVFPCNNKKLYEAEKKLKLFFMK